MAVISLNAHQVFASILTTKTVLANVFEVIGFKTVKKIVRMDPMRVSGYILLIYFCQSSLNKSNAQISVRQMFVQNLPNNLNLIGRI